MMIKCCTLQSVFKRENMFYKFQYKMGWYLENESRLYDVDLDLQSSEDMDNVVFRKLATL